MVLLFFFNNPLQSSRQHQKKPVTFKTFGSPFVNKRRAQFYDSQKVNFTDLIVTQPFTDYRQTKEVPSSDENSESELNIDQEHYDDEDWEDAGNFNFVPTNEYNDLCVAGSEIVIPIRHRWQDKHKLDQKIRNNYQRRSHENRIALFNQQRKESSQASRDSNGMLTIRKSSLSIDNSCNSSTKDKFSTDSGVNCTPHPEYFFNQLMLDHDISEIKHLSDDSNTLPNIFSDISFEFNSDVSTALLIDPDVSSQIPHHVIMAPDNKYRFLNRLPALERLSEAFLARSVSMQRLLSNEEQIPLIQSERIVHKNRWRVILAGTATVLITSLAVIIMFL